jgi:hypothetical protein
VSGQATPRMRRNAYGKLRARYAARQRRLKIGVPRDWFLVLCHLEPQLCYGELLWGASAIAKAERQSRDAARSYQPACAGCDVDGS